MRGAASPAKTWLAPSSSTSFFGSLASAKISRAFLDRDKIVVEAVNEKDGHANVLDSRRHGVDAAKVVHKRRRKRARRLIPHASFVGCDHAEFGLGESFCAHHAGEGNEMADSRVGCGAEDADGRAHAVSRVADGKPVAAGGINDGAEVVDFLGDARILESSARLIRCPKRKTAGRADPRRQAHPRVP